MDQRHIFHDLQALHLILTGLLGSGKSVSFLLDDNGLTRMQGVVAGFSGEPQPDRVMIKPATGAVEEVPLRAIIAVDGIFRADYTEC